jgi:hypothetical protein
VVHPLEPSCIKLGHQDRLHFRFSYPRKRRSDNDGHQTPFRRLATVVPNSSVTMMEMPIRLEAQAHQHAQREPRHRRHCHMHHQKVTPAKLSADTISSTNSVRASFDSRLGFGVGEFAQRQW